MKFQERLRKENEKVKGSIPEDKVHKIFSNIGPLHKFHSQFLLPELEKRLSVWHSKKKVCDVIKAQAPFLKLYSEYINSYKKATESFDQCQAKNKKFASIVQNMEGLPECDNLALKSHLIQPVQRVARYPLLMKEYLKHLSPDHADRRDTEESLRLVLNAAEHADSILKKLEKYSDVLDIQKLLGHQISILTPSREMVLRGPVTKISGRTQEHQKRELILFNDLILLCSIPSVSFSTKYKLRAIIELDGLSLLEGDNLEEPYTLYLRSKDRILELCFRSADKKKQWRETIWKTLQDYASRVSSFSSPKVASPEPMSPTPGDETPRSGSINSPGFGSEKTALSSRACPLCDSHFSPIRRPATCKVCGSPVCKKCSGNKPLTGKGRVCDVCHDRGPEVQGGTEIAPPSSAPSIFAGFLELKLTKSRNEWVKRYFAVREDMVLYEYSDDKQTEPLCRLPLSGCSVELTEKTQDQKIFRLGHNRRTYQFRAPSEELMTKWMTVLELSSNAELPNNKSE